VPQQSQYDQAINEEQIKGFNPIGPIPIAKDTIPPISQQYTNMLPKFLRDLVQSKQMNMGLMQAREPNASDVAHVSGWHPQTVQVDSPDMFSQGVLAHEGTHVFQNSRQFPPKDQDKYPNNDPYDYGGMKGLQDAVTSRKTIHDFGPEQQAMIVEDYYRFSQAVQMVAQKQGYLTHKQSQMFEEFKKVYEPFVKQLAGQTKYQDSPADESKSMPPAPMPPSLPPGDVVGLTEASPTMGGMPMRVKPK
jgi:hypothetical protein